MFKVFRIKEEHSAFLSDGGGIGSRGLASVRPHHASLCLRSPTVCLSHSPCSSSLFCPLLHVYCISLHLSPSCLCVFVDLLSLSLTLHHFASCYLSSLASAASLLLLPLLTHPSPLPLTAIIHPVFIIYAVFYLPSSLPPSTCASVSPPSLSFPMEAHKADGYIIGCSTLKRGMT